MRMALAFSLALLAVPALADPVASLSDANSTGPGAAVTFAAPASSVAFTLRYSGTGGMVAIEGSTDGVAFASAALLQLADPAGTAQGEVYFDKPRHLTGSRDAPVTGPPVIAVRANLLGLGGASDVTVMLDK